LDRVKRISEQILEIHGNVFTEDFEKNKEILMKVAVIRSKQLRNEVAGFITKTVQSRLGSRMRTPETVTVGVVKPTS